MKKDLATEIQKRKLHCIFISPHQDDALLSCGGLLQQLNSKTKITIINVFTKAHAGPYTLSARRFLKMSGYTDAQKLYDERQKEDKNTLSRFQSSVIDLGLEDALFRKKKSKTFLGKFLPEIDHIYPTYQWHILKSIAKDDYAVALLKKELQKYTSKKNIIFAPYGIGNHVDHVIVRKVCEKIFKNLVLYSDFPYNVRLNNFGKANIDQQAFTIRPSWLKKNKLIELYKTQFDGLFPGKKIPMHEEVYYVAKYLGFEG